MKSTFRVLFFLKRDKVKKNGNMPIMARITIDGKLAQFNTKLEVNPKNWSAKTGKVNGRGAEFTRMNEMLDSIKATLHRHYQTILGEFYQFNLSSCIRQQNSLTAQFVSFSLSNLANIFYPPPNFYNN